jgi:hypothetical protein
MSDDGPTEMELARALIESQTDEDIAVLALELAVINVRAAVYFAARDERERGR